MKKVITIILVFLIIFLSFPPGAYSDLKEEQRKLEEYKTELAEIKKEINNVNISKESAEQLLNKITDEIDAVSNNISVIENKINALKAEIAKDENLIQQKNQSITEREKQIEAVVNLSYKLTAISPIELLFSGKDTATIDERIAYLSYISHSNKNVLDNVKKERDLIKQEEDRLATSRNYLNEFLEEKEKQQAVLKEEVAAQNRFIAELKARKIDYIKKKSNVEEEIKKENALIAKLIEEANRSGGVLKTGLAWPAKGPITSPFGWRISPIWGGREFHQGIDIAVGTGTKVLAAASGVVTYAGWMTGYGNVVILYHGSNVSTLYAHLEKFTVRKGEHVKQGEVIAYSDDTGWSTGPHLHFGVYIGNKAVNPMKYLPHP